jgi:uncharacterized peroxidase-related enzyme
MWRFPPAQPLHRTDVMTRLHTGDVNEATGKLAGLFGAIKQAVGKVSNAHATLGSNSPALLAHVLEMGSMLQTESMLTKRELEAINLAVSESSGCDYCLAAHTVAGKAAGYAVAETIALRDGTFGSDPKIAALMRFALLLVNSRGTLPADAVDSVQKAGYTDRQIVETISAILLTNMLNRLNDTALDFPKAP